MDNRITLFIQPLTGLRLLGEEKTEEGSIIALRKDGDECLYVPRTEDERGMTWIPIGEFSVDPEAVTPVEFSEAEPQPGEGEETPQGEGEGGDQPHEVTPRSGPFGGRKLKRRTEVDG